MTTSRRPTCLNLGIGACFQLRLAPADPEYRMSVSVYLLPTGRTTRVNDMRLCKPVVVSEIRIPPTTDKAPVIVAFVFLRHDHDWLTKVRLGFPPCHIGEGELVLTTTPIVEEITRIACQLQSDLLLTHCAMSDRFP